MSTMSLVTMASQDDIRAQKASTFKSFRHVLPLPAKLSPKSDKHEGRHGNDDGSAPLLNYTQLYRQFADPNDELLSYPVYEEEPVEPTNVMY